MDHVFCVEPCFGLLKLKTDCNPLTSSCLQPTISETTWCNLESFSLQPRFTINHVLFYYSAVIHRKHRYSGEGPRFLYVASNFNLSWFFFFPGKTNFMWKPLSLPIHESILQVSTRWRRTSQGPRRFLVWSAITLFPKSDGCSPNHSHHDGDSL